MENICPFLFTYGTLMSRFDNEYARLLRSSAILVGEGVMTGKLYQVDWYPAAIYDPHSKISIHGEVFSLHSEGALLQKLDEYEDVLDDTSKSLYLRIIAPITLNSGETVNSWVYVYNQPTKHLQEIISGRF